MKDLAQSLFIAFTLMGMVFSCSGHRALEETSFEIEETELEDLLTRRDESEHANRKAHFLKFHGGRNRPQITLDGSLNSNHLVGHPRSERTRHNGIGSYLII